MRSRTGSPASALRPRATCSCRRSTPGAPAQLAEIARKQKALELDGEAITAARRQQEIDQAGALAYAQAAHTISDAERERLRAAHDNIEAARTNLSLVGQGVAAAEQLRFAQQQLSSAEAAAAQNGVTVSRTERQAIEQLAEAYGKLQEKIALRQLDSDIAFQRSQLGRTSGDQSIASQLRGIFGDDLTSSQAQFYAQQLRVNQSLTDLKATAEDIAGGALSDFNNDLRNGTGLLGALADAAGNAFTKIGQKFAEAGIDQLVSSVFGGGSGGGSWVDSLLGAFGLGSKGPSFGPGPLNIGIPSFATGTSSFGGLARINEQGGEIIDLPNGSRVIPHDVSMAMAAGAGGPIVSLRSGDIYINGSGGVTRDDVETAVAAGNKALMDQLPEAFAYYQSHPRRR